MQTRIRISTNRYGMYVFAAGNAKGFSTYRLWSLMEGCVGLGEEKRCFGKNANGWRNWQQNILKATQSLKEWDHFGRRWCWLSQLELFNHLVLFKNSLSKHSSRLPLHILKSNLNMYQSFTCAYYWKNDIFLKWKNHIIKYFLGIEIV